MILSTKFMDKLSPFTCYVCCIENRNFSTFVQILTRIFERLLSTLTKERRNIVFRIRFGSVRLTKKCLSKMNVLWSFEADVQRQFLLNSFFFIVFKSKWSVRLTEHDQLFVKNVAKTCGLVRVKSKTSIQRTFWMLKFAEALFDGH